MFLCRSLIPFHDERDVFPTRIQAAVSICQILCAGMTLYATAWLLTSLRVCGDGVCAGVGVGGLGFFAATGLEEAAQEAAS